MNYYLSLNCSHDCFINKTNVLGIEKKCVENCQDNAYYKYEYNHVCMNKCPFGTHHIYREEYLCQRDVKCKEFKTNISACMNNLAIGYYIDQKDGIYKPCYKACKTCYGAGDINNNNCIEYLMDIHLDEFRGKINTINTNEIDKGNDYYEYQDNVIYTLTSSFNQKNNQYVNVSSIDLGECEKKIIAEYGLPNNSNFYILKIDYLLPGTKTPKIEYELYYPLNGTNLTLLNISACKDVKIDIYFPTNITLDELYKYNPKNDFYNDICKTHTSESGTDIILSDRRNEFVDNNMNVCEEDCELVNLDKIHNSSINRVKCTCYTKINLPILSEVKIDKNKLLNNFKDIKNMININLLKCINLMFNSGNIFKNFSNYMILFLFSLSIASIIVFILYDYIRIKKIIKILRNTKKIAHDEIYKKNIIETEKGKKKKNISEHISKGKNKYIDLKIKNKAYNRIKKRNKKIEQRRRSFFSLLKNLRKSYNNNKNIRKYKKRPIKINENKSNSKTIADPKHILFKNNNTQKETLNIIKKIAKNTYNDNELNFLNYKIAKKIDKRNYIQYYFSLLKTQHLLFFSFFNYDDYNSLIIKIYIFFFTIQIQYAISAMFYTDEVMHKIYEDEGSFDFIYQIPQMLYSSILSLILSNLICNLGLYENNILKIKNHKYIIHKKQLKKERNIIKIKIILFFIVTYFLLFSFWVYVGCFCAVYKNTQIHLLNEVLSSFGMSLITPLFIYLIPGIFRIPSLKDGRKSNRPLLFKFSKILQHFL